MAATPVAIGFGVLTGITLASVLAVALGLAALISVFRDANFSRGARAMWLVVILLFPIFGSLVYFGVRSDW